MGKFGNRYGYQIGDENSDGRIDTFYKVKKDGELKAKRVKQGWLFAFEEDDDSWTLTVNKGNKTILYTFNDDDDDGNYKLSNETRIRSKEDDDDENDELYDDSYKIEDLNSDPLIVFEYEDGRWVVEDSDDKTFELTNPTTLVETKRTKDGFRVREFVDMTPNDDTYIYTLISEMDTEFERSSPMAMGSSNPF
jgi:hypothetical protein